MVYLDTSVLAAYYCPEKLSARAERAILAADEPAISWLTEVEMQSALQGKVLRGECTGSDRAKILTQFRRHIEEGGYAILPVDREHYAQARAWIGLVPGPLRTLDALHLAVCYLADGALLTADRALGKAAGHLGLRTVAL